MKFISSYAFSGCGYLTEINLPKTVESITYNENDSYSSTHCFDNCMIQTISFSSPISNLNSINASSENSFFSSENGVLYSKDKSTLIAFPSGRTGNFTVPSKTSIIGEMAFVFSNLTNLILSGSVSTIQNRAIFGFRKIQSIRVLNPSCKFEDGWSFCRTDSDNCKPVIYAPLNSTAHKFATQNNYTFNNISDTKQKYTGSTLNLYYSSNKNNIELGDVVNVGADYLRGNSLGMLYDGDMRWELSNPKVLQVVSYGTKTAVLYFKAVGLGSCDITFYLDGKKVISDTITVKVSDQTLLENNSEYVFNTSAFSTLETARNTCKEIIDGYNSAQRSLAAFFKSVENGLGVGVITKEALALAGITTSMSEDAEDKAVEMIMMELIGADENPVGNATEKIKEIHDNVGAAYSIDTADEEEFLDTLVYGFDYTRDQAQELYKELEDYQMKTEITFDVMDVTFAAMLVSQFEMDTIRDMRDATSYGSSLYLTLDRLYAKRSDLVGYATKRFLSKEAINLLGKLVEELGGPTYKIANAIGTWAKMLYDCAGGLDAEAYLVAQNNWGFAGYFYNYSLKTRATAQNFERYYKYYIASVKAALKSAVDISKNNRLTNIANGLYEQINSTCHYEGYFDQVREDLYNVSSISKETSENGKAVACYGGDIASYNLYNMKSSGSGQEANNNFYDSIESEKTLGIPAYIDGSKIEGISDYGFAGITDIQGFMLPQTIETIGEYAFANCNNVKFVYLNSGITKIGKGAFENCKQLEVLNLPESLQEIGEKAFSNCSKLGRITIGENVAKIDAKSFENCDGITSVYFYNEETVIATDAFADCRDLTIYGYEGSTAQSFADNNGFTFIAFENAVLEMNIITPATQKEIVEGEDVSLDGLLVEVVYMDGTKETIDGGWSIVCDTATVGEQQVYVCYKNGSVSYPITVTQKVIENITLSDHDISMFVTDSYQLETDYKTGCVLNDLIWNSDNEEIVSVDESGYLTAIKAGTANITVSLKDGSIFDTCKITVCNDEKLVATDGNAKSQVFAPKKSGYYTFYSTGSTANTTAILYNTKSEIIGMHFGKNIMFSAWLVDDEAYYIEIVTENGNELTFVVAEATEAKGIKIIEDKFSGQIGELHQLEVNFEPLNSIAEELVWKSSDEEVVSVDQTGLIKLLKKGSATITVTSTSGLSAAIEVTVEGYPVIITGESKTVNLDQNNPESYFSFTPNANGYYTFYSYNNSFSTYGCMLDSDMNELSNYYDYGDGNNFKIIAYLEAGVTYILKSNFYYTDYSGTVKVGIKKSDHIYNSGKVSKEPTCKEMGVLKYTCMICGKTKTESIHKISKHTYTDATCSKAKTCKICGVTSGNALGHTGGTATCKSKAKCSRCGVTYGSLADHKYDSGKVTKKATCKATGVKTFTCTVCKATKTSTIAKTTTHTYDSGKVIKKATCKETGKKTQTCTVCKATKTSTIAKSKTHTYKTTTTKATIKSNGKIVKKCTVCGKVASTSTIKRIKTIKLATTSYTYNGKVKTPTVVVKDSAGKTLKKNTDYTVKYLTNRKSIGTHKVKITFKGKYSGSKTLTFTISLAKSSVSKLTAGKKRLTVSVKKASNVSGYQIQYSTNKKFTNAKTKTITSYKTTKATIKGLSAKKTYYVRVRTYKTVSGKKYYSAWSTYKYKKTK